MLNPAPLNQFLAAQLPAALEMLRQMVGINSFTLNRAGLKHLSQFTADAFTAPLKALGVQISMDGRGAWRDNVFVERLWKSVKYEEVYLHAYDSVAQAKMALARYIDFYNSGRPHSSLDKKTPDEFYFATLPAIKQAA